MVAVQGAQVRSLKRHSDAFNQVAPNLRASKWTLGALLLPLTQMTPELTQGTNNSMGGDYEALGCRGFLLVMNTSVTTSAESSSPGHLSWQVALPLSDSWLLSLYSPPHVEGQEVTLSSLMQG